MAKFELTGKGRLREPMSKVLLPSGQEIYIQKRLKYLAADEDGTLCGYARRPIRRGNKNGYWYIPYSMYENLGCVNFKGDWRESLMRIVKGRAEFVKQEEV